jgi:putative spermidine/putrescine transport system permease protein
MAEATADRNMEVMTTADGTPLKVSLRRAMRRNKIKTLLLVAPLFLFIFFSFLMPIFDMMTRSVKNPEVPSTLTRTAEIIDSWGGQGLPSEEVFAAMAADLKEAGAARTIGSVAKRLNYEESGMRGLLMKSQRKVRGMDAPAEGTWKATLLDIDDDWGEQGTWQVIKRESSWLTASYYLAAIDMRYNEDGEIVSQPSYQQIYVKLFWRTLWISGLITALTVLLGYPIAYLMATLPARTSNLLMILVLLPFWTSLLVRTTTWIVMLQTEGVLNDIMVWTGLISDAGRLQMIYNQTGTIVAMTHILLPFMVLPLYSVMKGIPPSYLRAARSLGANPLVAYWRVYVPLTTPGIGAGGILVFILSIGYFITPALVGGQSGQLISNMIAYHMQTSLNWGLAAALGTILLIVVLGLYLLYNKIVGIDNMKLG